MSQNLKETLEWIDTHQEEIKGQLKALQEERKGLQAAVERNEAEQLRLRALLKQESSQNTGLGYRPK